MIGTLMHKGRRLAGAVLLVTAAAGSWAHGGHEGPPPPPPGMGGVPWLEGRPEHIDRAVEHLLRRLDATDAQRTQIKQIAQAAAKDLRAQREAARALDGKALVLFAAPTLDEPAIEAQRQQRLARHDAVSRRVTQALIDVAKVLTPEQRAKLGERMAHRRAPGGPRGPGPHPGEPQGPAPGRAS